MKNLIKTIVEVVAISGLMVAVLAAGLWLIGIDPRDVWDSLKTHLIR